MRNNNYYRYPRQNYSNQRQNYSNRRQPMGRQEREAPEFTVAVSTPQQSRYEGQYVTLSFKYHKDAFFRVYLSVNQFGAYKAVKREDLEDLYFALGDVLGFNQQQQQQQPRVQQRQPQQQQQQQQHYMPAELTEEDINETNQNTLY